ncbi:MAG: PfkB family carbohydrate kinase [Halolamina sp.]
MTRVVSLGSINVDRVRTVEAAELEALEARDGWFPGPGETVTVEELPGEWPAPDRIRHGGKGANQAIAARAAGADTTLLGKVGHDHEEFGVLEALREAAVDVSAVGIAAVPTGTAEVFVDPDGENRITISSGANDAIDTAYIDEQYDIILAADCLLLQNEVPVEPVAELLDRLREEPDRPTVVLDPAPAEGVDPLLGYDAVDYLTPNEHEYATIGDALAEFDGIVIHKRGGDTVTVEGDTPVDEAIPPEVDAVDTTGAGDVLSGFLAAGLAAGDEFSEALDIAVIAGSLSTTTPGAREGIPTLEELRRFRAADG